MLWKGWSLAPVGMSRGICVSTECSQQALLDMMGGKSLSPNWVCCTFKAGNVLDVAPPQAVCKTGAVQVNVSWKAVETFLLKLVLLDSGRMQTCASVWKRPDCWQQQHCFLPGLRLLRAPASLQLNAELPEDAGLCKLKSCRNWLMLDHVSQHRGVTVPRRGVAQTLEVLL
ncbi:hypothetical protein DV515_00004127 [Chloebia gouldiae]|uniref:Uncharacterized protein n=1 Tax=Chloebia gouldiae TaxID=44316 RepID=A0A3L8SRA9_CHLGU|nr:hypothetical protein DV515_00004127 [Chloebia gouldiae]